VSDVPRNDYSLLDRPDVLSLIFHPRPEIGRASTRARDVLIPVEDRVVVGARFHLTGQSASNILFFHGNGEIVADYDNLGPLYNQKGINFLPVDYRGYGRSTGKPTVTAMMKDCHLIFQYVSRWLPDNGFSGPLIVMGRSLGSASALELAACYRDFVGGLIIESGFAYAGPLLKLLGIDVKRLGFEEKNGFGNVDKIRRYDGPTLILHAEWDHIIPFKDGRTLFDACPSRAKTFLRIPQADHNDIFIRGLAKYMTAVKALADRAGSTFPA
jgi:fermentation-respiration switch protein FrsA (DUF1100 family)